MRTEEGATGVVVHEAAVTIGRSVDDVTRYVFDPTTMPHWSAVLYEIGPIADVEPRLGRRLRANLKILGVKLTVEGELIELDLEARRAAVRIVPTGGDGSIEHRLWVDASGAGSVVHFWNRVELPQWLSRGVGEGLVARFVDHTATFALANIKDILEHGEEHNVSRLSLMASQELPGPERLRLDHGDGQR